MMGIVRVAVVVVISESLISEGAVVNCKLLIRLGSNFTLIFPILVWSELFNTFTAISFSVRSEAVVAAH